MVNRPEQELQRGILTHLFRNYPAGFVFHVANDARGARAGYQYKLNGVKAGVPDLVVVRPRGRIGWIEVKAGAAVSAVQLAVHARYRELGHQVHVVKSLEQMKIIVDEWIKEDASTPLLPN